jgi:hypothetical protein
MEAVPVRLIQATRGRQAAGGLHKHRPAGCILYGKYALATENSFSFRHVATVLCNAQQGKTLSFRMDKASATIAYPPRRHHHAAAAILLSC